MKNSLTGLDQVERRPSMKSHHSQRLTVYFDGDCPICRWEVAHYRRLDRAAMIEWIDINELGETDLPADKSRQQLLGVFHARSGEDSWVTGVDAFAQIWSKLPMFRYFAWVFRTPVFRHAAQLFYRLFLAWQRRDREGRRRRLRESHVTSN